MKSQDSGNIGSSGFEAIREKIRNLFCVGSTSGSSAEQRIDLADQFAAYEKSACTLRPAKPLMTGKSQCTDLEIFHIHRNGSGSLGSIQNK